MTAETATAPTGPSTTRPGAGTTGEHPRVQSAEIDAVLAAARVLVDVVAASIADVEVTLPQFRILLMVATQGPLNLSAVAEGLDVHPSNATRACDRLVGDGLLDRREPESDRRHVEITLTDDGQRLVDSVMRRRRRAVAGVLSRMPTASRVALGPALEAFADAADHLPSGDAEPLGWQT